MSNQNATSGGNTARKPLPFVTPKPLLGQWVANFEVQSLLGQGPVADCYVARERKTGASVCVKILSKNMFATEGDLLAFGNRLEVVSQRLDHPAANRPIAFGPLGTGLCYIASFYEQYVSVRRLLRSHRVFSEKVALATIRLTCKALEQAHLMGIVHANLKPSNVVLSRKGRAVTIDWASPPVSLMDAQDRLNVLPEREDVDRGLGYLAPELLNGQGKALPSTDLFSVGALLYYMLSGTEPALGNLETVRGLWEHRGFPELDTDDVFFSEATVQLLRRLTARNPSERYHGVGDVWPDLNQALGLPSV